MRHAFFLGSSFLSLITFTTSENDVECGNPKGYSLVSCIAKKCTFTGCDTDKDCRLLTMGPQRARHHNRADVSSSAATRRSELVSSRGCRLHGDAFTSSRRL